MSDAMVLMGIGGAPHGVRGQLRVKSLTGDPLAFGDYGPLQDKGGKRYTVTDIYQQKTVVVVTFKEVKGREAAEALNGTEFFVPRDALPDEELEEDEFFVEDLVGLAVNSETGQAIGKVAAVHNFGAGDLIEIDFSAGETKRRREMFAFSLANFPEIDLENGIVTFVEPESIIAREEDGDEGDEGDQ